MGVRNDTIQRIASDGGTSTSSSGGSIPKTWRLGSAFKKLQSRTSSGREDKISAHRQGSIAEADSQDDPVSEKGSIHGTTESSHRQLQALVTRIRSIPSGPNYLDAAYKEFFKIREQCAALCRSILYEDIKPPSTTASSATEAIRIPSLDVPRSLSSTTHFDQRSSYSGRSLAEAVMGSRAGAYTGDPWLSAIRDWRSYLESLAQSFEIHLAETYKSYERDATPEMVEALFSSKKFRKDAVHRMRNASVTKIMSADPQFFPRYEIRFRNYEKVKQELMDIRRQLQAGELGISPHRVVLELSIAPRGDVMLEFANLGPDAVGTEPALRFRVSSPLLADTSPIFARMFGGRPESHYVHEAEDISSQLPPPPMPYYCEDGSEVRLYRMPQLEVNMLESLEILLHAAHNHKEKLERDISFEQFVAIAQCCIRYRCTSPLEMMVEHRWLPQWMHKGAEDMPEGLLTISYAFGLRQLFTRMSKVAILNLVDQKDLQNKSWPRKVGEKLWAVRCAKIDQLYTSCASSIQEYLRQPMRESGPRATDNDGMAVSLSLNELDRRLTSPALSATTTLSSAPRCPKGSHWCDASNLGWMMLIYDEMGLLPHVFRPKLNTASPPHWHTSSSADSKSLAQLIEMLQSFPSPPTPVHVGTLCDPAPPFRAAIADVYGSMTGLCLYDISGKSHGWALSKNKMSEPQTFEVSGLDRMATHDDTHSVASEFPEDVRLRILREICDLRDLHQAARINRAFYHTYKRHELQLMRNILVAGRSQFAAPLLSLGDAEIDEGKVLKSESDRLKERGFGEGADVITLRSEEDEDEDEGEDGNDLSDSDDTGSTASEATIHNDVELAVLRDPPPPFRSQDSDPPPPLPPPPPPPSPPAIDEHVSSDDEPPMTDEEARRILWPDHLDEGDDTSLSSTTQSMRSTVGVEGLREKFRPGDVSFQGLEAKTLFDPGKHAGRGVGLTKDQLIG